MPSIKPNENKEDWIERCVPVVMKEGKNKKQALGQCYGMWQQNELETEQRISDKVRKRL